MCRKSICLILLVLAVVTTSGQAEVTPVTSVVITRVENPGGAPNFWLESITVGGYTVTADELVTGVSEGVATAQPAPYDDITNADNFDLNLFAGRADEVPPTHQIKELGGKSAWTDTNRDNPDFFLFETGGNQDFSIEAILPGGIIGQSVDVPQSTFGDTGLVITTSGPHNGQTIEGVAFAITDLLDQNGNHLTNSSVIEGIQISSPGYDPSGFYASVGGPVLVASNPDPADGVLYADTWANLSWSPGDFALSHDVYFSDNFDDVNNGAESAFQGSQTATFFVAGFPGFPFPDGLVPGTTYYWRIDEVNDTEPNSPWKGNVWSFTVPPKKAYDPEPPDGARFIDSNVELSWTAGFDAKLHTVYFGDNFDDVNNAVVGLPLGAATFTPGNLEFGKDYYWRVDEFDGIATHKGDVWSFKTLPDMPITDPNLVGWWKLDEGMGTIALDWSGYGHHGTFEGDPQWVDGYDGGALEFDGDDHVDTGYTENLVNWTITCWVISPAAPSGDSPSGPLHREQNYQFNWNHGDETYRGAAAMNVGGTWYAAKYMPLAANTWYHLAATFDGSVLKAYRDGVLITSNSAPTGPPNAESGTLKLGRHATAAQFFTGTVDDARVYNKALTLEEIQQAMRGDTTRAWGPSPANGSTPDIERATPLSWSPGDKVSGHDVYFGTDRDAVDNAEASDTTGLYRGQQVGTSYTPPEGVEWGGGPYYWRIDELNTDATVSRGGIWSFKVVDHILVDDFEDYDIGNNEIWWAWKDGLGYAAHGNEPAYPGNGTGSAVGDENTPSYTEETIVHGGSQSMPLFYNNNLNLSEAELLLSPAQDWTKHGVTVLSLYFHGDPSNAVEQMYVKVNGSKMVYGGDAADISQSRWNAWIIPLEEFANQGVNLQNVTSFSIGFGDELNIRAGGSGVVYFDDIRLYRSAPELPDEIWLEAEAADSITSPMNIYNDLGASGGRHIGTEDGISDENDNAPADGVATYNFTVAGGTYKILGRVKPDQGNSFWFRIVGATNQTHEDPDQPGTGWVRWNDIEAGADWHWDEVHSNDHSNAIVNWTLPAGTHTLEIARREDGGLLDAILITDDLD